jgi:hypothetical protein
LGLKRGCILLPDEAEGILSPWASSGLDETSLRRLRIPAKAMDSRYAAGPLVLEGNALQELSIYFSHRDFSGIASMRVLPLPVGADQQAYILSLEDSALGTSPAAPRDWGMLGPLIGERLAAFRKRLKSTGSDAADPGSDEAASIRQAILDGAVEARNKGLKALFMIVPMDGFLDAACSFSPLIERYRLFEETCGLISRILPPPGKVLPLPRFHAGILACSLSASDPELLLAQLGASLARIVPGRPSPHLSASASFALPADQAALDAILHPERSEARPG